MNVKEAIDEAKKHARIYVEDCKHYGYYMEHDEYDLQFSKKLIELIVKECADLIIARGTTWVDFAPSETGVRPEYWELADHLKQHFGIV